MEGDAARIPVYSLSCELNSGPAPLVRIPYVGVLDEAANIRAAVYATACDPQQHARRREPLHLLHQAGATSLLAAALGSSGRQHDWDLALESAERTAG